MFSKENWYQSYWFEFFRLNCVHLYMLMQEMQENYYLILFMFASQLYFYVLGPSCLLGY